MKNLIRFVLVLWVATLTAQTGNERSLNTQKLDSLFELLESNDKYMASIAVAYNGKSLYSNAIGFLDVENGVKANTASTYRVGSISKMFTSSLIFKAIEEGKLLLDQKLSDFYPQVENAEKITIKNLLNHSSGIVSFTDKEDYLDWNTQAQTREQMLERVVRDGSTFEPGSESAYSNSNYILLTLIAEDVLKDSYDNLIKKYITEPLDLKSTYVGKDINVAANEAQSYRRIKDWQLEEETDMSVPLGAGAIVSTPQELNIFITALMEGKIISKESLVEMKTITGGYGLGLFQFPYGEKESYGHTGGIDGFGSISGYFPEDQLAISITANGINYETNTIVLKILDNFFKGDFEMPTILNISLSEEELDAYVGNYVTTQIPISITIFKEEGTLMAQATGQGAFPLEPIGDHKFTFETAGVHLTFDPAAGSMILNQGGGTFTFNKE